MKPWWMNGYGMRYCLLWPLRQAVRLVGRIVSAIPGTTNGEYSEMHDGPCHRCVGRGLREEFMCTETS